jgi:hypothetical protein
MAAIDERTAVTAGMSHSGALSRLTIRDRRTNMFRWALRKAIGKFERDWNYDAGYMRDIIDASPVDARSAVVA